MIENLGAMAIGAVVGAVLGGMYFAGLWLTVRNIGSRRHPRRLLLASFVLRTALAVAVLVLVARHGAWPLLGASLGFLMSRPLVLRLVARLPGDDVTTPPATREPSP